MGLVSNADTMIVRLLPEQLKYAQYIREKEIQGGADTALLWNNFWNKLGTKIRPPGVFLRGWWDLDNGTVRIEYLPEPEDEPVICPECGALQDRALFEKKEKD